MGNSKQANDQKKNESTKSASPKSAGSSSRNESELEGEGSYSATERYNAGVQKTVESGKVDDLARKAKKALEGPEGRELSKAREAASHGKSLPKNPGTGHP